MLAIAHVDDDQFELRENLTWWLLPPYSDIYLEPLDGVLTPGYVARRIYNEQAVTIVLDGVREKRQIGYFFENIVFYYEKMLLSVLVPFLKSIYDLMYNVINLYTLLQYTVYIGP